MNRRVHFPAILFICSIVCHTSCKDSPTPPVVTTNNVTYFTQTDASAGGNVTSDGGSEVTVRGVCWNTSNNPTVANSKTSDGDGTGSFISSLTQLSPITKYYVKAYATNSEGTGYGDEVIFTTLAYLPTVITNPITDITTNSALSGGNIISDGGSTILAGGICWNTSSYPTIDNNKTYDGNGTGTFTSSLTGLTAHTIYYLRAYATNSAGTNYGENLEFITSSSGNDIIFNPRFSYGTLSDMDGNSYKTIQIGAQTWMAENLKTTIYNNGSPIPLLTDNTVLGTAGYCWYSNDINYKNTYGALYNWYVVNVGNLCPSGWHVPTDSEWTTLVTYLGDANNAGGKLKEIGTNHWYGPNAGSTNETGFTALPGGFGASNMAFFGYIEGTGIWWTSSERTSSTAEARDMNYLDNELHSGAGDKWYGLSVRCMKD